MWKQLIKKNKLYLSKIYPGQWYAIDSLQNLKDVKKNKKLKNYFLKSEKYFRTIYQNIPFKKYFFLF